MKQVVIGTAGGAQAPEGHVRFVHEIADLVGRFQTGRVADDAVHVGDRTADPAHEVVVVVTDPALVPGGAAGGFDAAYQARRGEGVQRLVHGLDRHVADPLAYAGSDRVDVEVIAGVHGFENRHPSGRDPQPGFSQLIGRNGPGMRAGSAAGGLASTIHGANVTDNLD